MFNKKISIKQFTVKKGVSYWKSEDCFTTGQSLGSTKQIQEFENMVFE